MDKRAWILMIFFFVVMLGLLTIGMVINYNLDFSQVLSLVYAQEDTDAEADMQIFIDSENKDKEEITICKGKFFTRIIHLEGGTTPYKYFVIKHQNILPEWLVYETSDDSSKITLSCKDDKSIPEDAISFQLTLGAKDAKNETTTRIIKVKVVDENNTESANNQEENLDFDATAQEKISEENDQAERTVGNLDNIDITLKGLRVSELKGQELMEKIIPEFASQIEVKEKIITGFFSEEQKNQYLQCAFDFSQIYDDFMASDRGEEACQELIQKLNDHQNNFAELNQTFSDA